MGKIKAKVGYVRYDPAFDLVAVIVPPVIAVVVLVIIIVVIVILLRKKRMKSLQKKRDSERSVARYVAGEFP